MNKNEISDLMVEAYTHQKNGELSLAIQSWNALLNHSSATTRSSCKCTIKPW